MSSFAAEAEVAAPVAEAPPREKPRTDKQPKRQPPYAVVLHNDDLNGFDFVIGSLRKVFNYNRARAFWLTWKAHKAGRAIVWTGHRELAELKADQLKSCGADPLQAHLGALPLRVTVEPLPQ
ncbi:MAG: ATP-dependent Clp protease adaptor ClpS [Planctomycetales bacterium]|nr:ATP-dependent Clp protease adaptor ClpS [Planctomycetales bacterium]MCA9221779.1 ATP-dependent Clp protease adaptor ClpS [Planctomycetales bacterium]